MTAGIHPKIVSERLGHASIGITLDTYSHVGENLQDEAAAKVASLMFDVAGEQGSQSRTRHRRDKTGRGD